MACAHTISIIILVWTMMSLFLISGSVVKKLNRLRREFLWKVNKEGGGYNFVKWDVVQLSIIQGVWDQEDRNLKIQNNSLLVKWLWRFSKEESSLWKEVISHKFGLDNF